MTVRESAVDSANLITIIAPFWRDGHSLLILFSRFLNHCTTDGCSIPKVIYLANSETDCNLTDKFDEARINIQLLGTD